MPLVTITCNEDWFPTKDRAESAPLAVLLLAKQLPHLMTTKLSRWLKDTPPEAVQVNFDEFHYFAVNTPELWFHVWFTEDSWSEAERFVLTDSFTAMLAVWFFEQWWNPRWKLDLFYGPGNGVVVSNGRPVITW